MQDDALRLNAMHHLFTTMKQIVQQFYPVNDRIKRAADYAILEVQAELAEL